MATESYTTTWDVTGRYEVLRFELMVERGLCEAATSIREGSAA